MSPTKIQSPAKHRTPIKRIDLGAAANYGKTQTVINSPIATSTLDTETSSVDLLNILNDNSNKQSNEFGDFNTAFSTPSSIDIEKENKRYIFLHYFKITINKKIFFFLVLIMTNLLTLVQHLHRVCH